MTLLSGLVGIVNTLLIAVINAAAAHVADSKSVTLDFFGYAALFILFFVCSKRANERSIKRSNELIYRFKIRIMHDVFRSNLLKIDQLGRDYILEVLIRDTQLVSQTVSALLSVFQALLTVFFLLLYLATVSVTASLILTAATMIVIVVGLLELNKLVDALQALSVREAQVNGLYGSFLSGFKEVKMNSLRALGLTRDMVDESKSVTVEKTELIQRITRFFLYLQMMMFLVVGLIIFVVPIF